MLGNMKAGNVLMYSKWIFQAFDNLVYVSLLAFGFLFIYQGDIWQRFVNQKTAFAEYNEPITQMPTMIIYIENVENKILASYEYGKDYNISMQTRAVENTTSWSKERNLTMGENLIGGVHHNLSVYFEKIFHVEWDSFLLTPRGFFPGIQLYISFTYNAPEMLSLVTLQLTTETQFMNGWMGSHDENEEFYKVHPGETRRVILLPKKYIFLKRKGCQDRSLTDEWITKTAE